MATTESPLPIVIPLPSSPPYEHRSSSPFSPEKVGPDTPARSPHTSVSAFTRSSLTSTDMDEVSDYHRRYSSGPSGRSSSSPIKDVGRKRMVQLEDFELIKVIGKGCAGRVLLVRHSRRNTVHAMKAISKRSVLATDELHHTLTELSILKRFTTHEPDNGFVTRLNYSFTDRENFYFVMDFYPGGDLATQLEIHGSIGPLRTRFYACDLVLALEDLHRHGVVLRDIKPENILLNAEGHCVIADFGLSKQFEYRGDPQPLYVPLYQGEAILPPWAGQGLGSVRAGPTGTKRIVVDRAYSFVGTTEYLAPEVVRGQEYSYPVDWWGLGCILFECLTGRVPFKKYDEDPPQVLYNQILYEPWDHIFDQPRWAVRRLDMGVDDTTSSFLDALLQKDPTRRLTEPCVRKHPYFTYIEWDMVRSGSYNDPHTLHLHPVAEYNTRYFPRLCLEQDPSVDMSTHNREDSDEMEDTHFHRRLTALNDENTYKFEQLKHMKELEGFYWSREEHEWIDEEDEEVDAGMQGSGDKRASLGGVKLGQYDSTASFEPVQEGDAHRIVPTEVDSEPDEDALADDTITPTVQQEVIEPGTRVVTPKLTPIPLSGAMSSVQLGSPVASPEQLITPDTSSREIPVHIENETNREEVPGVVLQTEAENAKPADSKETGRVSPSPPADFEVPVAAPPITITGKPVPIPTLSSRPKPDFHLARLPSGLPASGLSVSDVVSIPSPGLDGPRLIRRHPGMPSVESVPMARLSIDLHGTIAQLGDDDWEALEAEKDLPSAPNGYGPGVPPSSFFNRLRRRPSTIITSGLRRQTQARSSSSSSRDSSPTEPAVRSTSRKALGKLKAFPILRRRRNSDNVPDIVPNRQEALLTGNTPGSRKTPSPRVSRPSSYRRNTESGWFERKLSRGKSMIDAANGGSSRSLTQSSKGSESGKGKEGIWGSKSESLVGDGSSPPRVELKETGPVLWAFGEVGSEAEGKVADGEKRKGVDM